MSTPAALRRKLSRRVIGKHGFDTVILRRAGNAELDMYGEPVSSGAIENIDVRIVVDTNRRDNEQTEIGGMPDPSKEYLYFYTKGDFDIRMGDRIIYPVGTDNYWLIDRVEPQVFKGIVVIVESRAYRDNRLG